MLARTSTAGFLLVFVAVLWCAPGDATAGLFKKWKRPPACPTPWRRLVRAGKPHWISRWARPSNEPGDCGYYVGGGAAFHGEPAFCHEGTWGWDYTPWYSRVKLGWWHGRRHQGGTGQYEPDRRNR